MHHNTSQQQHSHHQVTEAAFTTNASSSTCTAPTRLAHECHQGPNQMPTRPTIKGQPSQQGLQMDVTKAQTRNKAQMPTRPKSSANQANKACKQMPPRLKSDANKAQMPTRPKIKCHPSQQGLQINATKAQIRCQHGSPYLASQANKACKRAALKIQISSTSTGFPPVKPAHFPPQPRSLLTPLWAREALPC